MTKIILLSAVACCMVFYACKKDGDTDSTKPAPEDTIAAPLIDPVALASNVKIGYGGTSITGAFPATTTSAATPVLDSIYDGRTYNTVNNRYVVIYPRVMSGFISGYYLKINGADSYFKIDYSSAYGVRKAKSKKTGARDAVDNVDSSIVIKIPDGLKGDTFSIKYAAYDSLNNVSNTISAIVKVSASANATDDALVMGSWHETAYKDYETADWEPKNDIDSGDFRYYICVDGQLQDSDGGIEIPSYRTTNTYDLIFSAKNAYQMVNFYNRSYLDLGQSSCSNFVFNLDYGGTEYNNGGYSYNATTKVITLINDQNGTGNYITTTLYHVKEITATTLVIYEIYDDNNSHDEVDIEYTQFRKN
jgi:hypothetical protein